MKDNFQNIVISKKQFSLTQRLQTICDKINRTVLPMEVNRIEAFGSYIRGKENPNDIDLVLYYSNNQDLNLIYDFLVEICKKIEYDFQSNPKEVVLRYLKENSTELVAGYLSPIYSAWLEGFTWKHMEYGHHPPYKQAILRKMLTGRTKNIHISSMVMNGEKPYIIAKETRVIWSPEKPLVFENYKEILMYELDSIAQAEFKNMNFQLEWIKFKNKILRGLFVHLLNFDTKIHPIKDVETWIDEELTMLFPSFPDTILKAAVHDARRGSNSTIFQSEEKFQEAVQKIIPSNDFQHQNQSVESVRGELKEENMELEVISKAFNLLQEWREKESSDPYYWPAPLWVALRTLIEVPKKRVPEETIRKYMRDFNLPEEKIFTDRSSGRVDYGFIREEIIF